MITHYFEKFNEIIKKYNIDGETFIKIYNYIVENINMFSITCPCGATGNLIKYGHYTRNIKIDGKIVTISIQRFKCKSCGHTHAFLTSNITPYTQILVADAIDIIRARTSEQLINVMENNPVIDESNISYIKKQFKLHWEQRLISENIQLDSDYDSLIFQCFSFYNRQFMQIRNTINKILLNTNIPLIKQFFLII